MEYEIKTEDGTLSIDTFQGSVDLSNESGKITLTWDEVHKLNDLIPKAVEDAEATYWPIVETVIENGF